MLQRDVDDLRTGQDVVRDDGGCADDSHVSQVQAVVANDVLSRAEIVNVALDQCDIAGLVGRECRASRVHVTESRLRGITWMAGMLEDVVLESVTGSDVSVRFSTLRRVVFRDCVLPGLDFTEATLDDVRLERCVVHGARFHGARVRSLRIEGCDLAGCTGAESLAGASVHPDDLLSLGPSLASALGLTVRGDDA